MKSLILFIIRMYWFFKPKHQKSKCIFKVSCSKQVYQVTKEQGGLKGLKEFRFRWANCQPYYDIYTDHMTGRKKMKLKTGIIVDEEQIAERFLKSKY